MKAEIKGNTLTITMDMQEPRPSASGKTLVVATSGGNKTTAAMINGVPVINSMSGHHGPDKETT